MIHNMKKIITIAGAFLLLPSMPIYAQTKGVNLGLEIGDALSQIEHKIRDTDPGNASNSITAQGTAHGLNAGINAGYMLNINSDISLNISLNGTWYGQTTNVANLTLTDGGQTVNISSKEKLKHSFGIQFQPMFQLHNDTSLFVTLGYHRGYFNTSITDQDIGEATQSRTINDNRDGFQYGIGVATNLTEKMQATFGVTKTDFKSKQLISGNDFGLNSKFSVVKVNLGLAWMVGL